MGCVIVATTDQASCELADEVMILQLSDGCYYGLDAVGARIWQLLQVPRSVSDLRDAVLAEFEVSEEQCERDLLRLLGELRETRLIDVVDVAP